MTVIFITYFHILNNATYTTSLLARVTDATFISPIGGFWSGGISEKYISKGGAGVRTIRMAGTAGTEWEGSSPASRGVRQAYRDGKIFSGGIVCASL